MVGIGVSRLGFVSQQWPLVAAEGTAVSERRFKVEPVTIARLRLANAIFKIAPVP